MSAIPDDKSDSESFSSYSDTTSKKSQGTKVMIDVLDLDLTTDKTGVQRVDAMVQTEMTVAQIESLEQETRSDFKFFTIETAAAAFGAGFFPVQ